MTICQYCGRVHSASLPNPRFCSVLCSRQYEQYWLEDAVTLTEEQAVEERETARQLTLYSINVARAARMLLTQIKEQSLEQQATSLKEWASRIAAQESKLIDLNEWPITPSSTDE